MKSKKKKNKKKKRPTQMPISHKHEYLAMLLVSALCLVVFGRIITFDAFSIDIPEMIFKNPHIMTGLSWENIWWTFTEPNLALYQPFLNIMYMIESYAFGNWPGGYHVVTLLCHITCMCLFLWVITRLTNNFAVAFAATLLMSIHPVQILVVSQIVTRNEILQAFFMLLSVEAYRRYVQNNSHMAYYFSALFMFMGLFCKQIIIMLPFVLLLLDYWPFKRIEVSWNNYRHTMQTAFKLIVEKTPWFVLSFLGGSLALYGKMQYSQIEYHISQLTIPDAIYFIICGYARYVGHLFYPLRLAYFEVYSEDKTLAFFLISLVVLILISTITLLFIRKRPYLIVGWLWFIIFLFPVSGILRYMMESIALRYLYVPAMGLYLALLMCLYEIATSRKSDEESQDEKEIENKTPQWYWYVVGSLTCILAVLTFWQNSYFTNSETIANQLLKINNDRSALGHNALAVLRVQQERFEEAEEHFKRCVEIQPESYPFRYSYAGLLYTYEKYQQVVDVIAPAVQGVPDEAKYLELYGLGLMATGLYTKAGKELEKALEIEPDTLSLIQNMAYCLILQGKYKEAQAYLEKGLKQAPDNPALLQLQKMAHSVVDYSPN